MMRPLILLVTAATLLQGCEAITTTTTVPVPPPAFDLASCHAVGLDGLIGQPVRLIPATGAWSALRVIYPGQAVTMDYSATRLNVRVNAAGIIQSLSCG
jgi:hypothetical protein